MHSRSSGHGALSPAEILAFAGRRWPIILVPALLAGAAAAAFLKLQPPSYSATAVLAVAARVSAETLAPQGLALEGYQAILDSPELKAETRRRLQAAGELDDRQRLQLGSRISVPKRAQQNMLGPVLEARAEAGSAELAAAAANTWSEVLVEHVGQWLDSDLERAAANLEQLEPGAQEALAKLDREHRQQYENYLRQRVEAVERWSRELATAWRQGSKKSESLARQARVELLRMLETELPPDVDAGTPELLSRWMDTRWQLAVTPAVLTLENPPAPPAPANAPDSRAGLAACRSGELSSTPSLRHEPNPEHRTLMTQADALEIRLHRDHREWADRHVSLLDGLSELFASATAAQAKQAAEQHARLEILYQRRETELAALECDWLTTRVQLARRAERWQALIAQLAFSYAEAAVAGAGRPLAPIRMAARAAPPPSATSRRASFKVALATLAGLALGLTLALFAEVKRQTAPAA
jgi:hypothetical protein